MDVDDALYEAGGEWGRFQLLLYVLFFISAIPNAFTFMHFVYSNHVPPHRCKLPQELKNNDTVEADSRLFDFVYPKETDNDGNTIYSECKMYDRNYSEAGLRGLNNLVNDSASIIACPNGWDFDSPPQVKTAAMEMSFICEDDWKSPMIVTIFMAGVATCSLSGALSDKFGRRPVFLGACLVQVISTACTVLAQEFYSYAVLSFINGMSSLLNYVVGFVISTEMTHRSIRNFMSISAFVAYGTGYCIVSGLSFAFQNWRMNLGMMAIFSGIIYLPNIWLMPESVRWLTQKGRKDEAMELLKKVAKMNGNLEKFESLLEGKNAEVTIKDSGKNTGIIKSLSVIFKSGIAMRCVTVMLCWFTTSLVYFAVSYYSSGFSEDRFLNVLLAGVAEYPAYLMVYFSLQYLGRPRAISILLGICGCTSITLAFLPDGSSILKTILAMSGKGAVSAGFYVDYMMAAEVVPTLERGSFLSLSSFTARIGAFIAPFLIYLVKVDRILPNLLMGTLALLSAVAALMWIPETKDLAMPDTVAEVKQNNRFYRFNVLKSFGREEGYKQGKMIENGC